jgi:hypothetical protein
VGGHVWSARLVPATVELVSDAGKRRKARTMIETRNPRITRTDGARARATVTGSGRRSLRAGSRLWMLLRAQALLGGPAGGPGDPAVIEDDRRRMAGRQAR